jgi:hypothetical protein
MADLKERVESEYEAVRKTTWPSAVHLASPEDACQTYYLEL